MFALKLLMQSLGSQNIDCRQDGAALDPALGRASYIFNPTIAGIEQRRRDPDRRRQSAPRGAGAQRPHPQALARRRSAGRRHRRGRRPDLRLRASRRRSGLADAIWPTATATSSRCCRRPKQPLIIVGQGALSRADGAAVLGLAAQARAGGRRGQRRLERLCRPAHGGRARRRPRPRLRAGRGRQRRRRHAAAATLDVLFLLGADEIDMAAPAAPSSSISARMATPARTAPTSSCRAPPTPRSPAPTSTPRAACRWPTAPASRRARRARTGRSCARCPTCSASRCRSTRWRSCARKLYAAHPASRAHRCRSRRPTRPMSAGSRRVGGELGKDAVPHRRSRTST